MNLYMNEKVEGPHVPDSKTKTKTKTKKPDSSSVII